MFERVCLVHYHEIGLKGHNRSSFERRLRENLDAALVGFPVYKVDRLVGRVAVRVKDSARTFEVAERIAAVPGVGSVSVGYRTSREPDEMERAAILALQETAPFKTFAVEAKRSNTDYTESSMEMNRRIGAALQKATGAGVNLTNPDSTVSVLVTGGESYVLSARVKGVGGLPVGTAGRIISLLSAGIDSPVATWRMMRRGAVVVGVHFSGRPQTNDLSERLVADLAHRLEPAGGLGRVYFVPFGDLQKEISLSAPPDLRILMYRRLMIKVAERIAHTERAKALVTGESLGQVASQTLENIVAVDEAATMPVLRPLIGSDKLEIMAEARRLGTLDLSTEEHADCCTLFMPRNPETHAKLPEVLAAWREFDVDRMVDDAIAGMSWTDFRCPSYRPPKRYPTPAGETGSSVSQVQSTRSTTAEGDR